MSDYIALRGKQAEKLAEFANGTEVRVWEQFKWTTRGVPEDIVRWIHVFRVDNATRVNIYVDGTVERLEGT